MKKLPIGIQFFEERDYHGQYMDGRNITLIGIGIDAVKRKIGGNKELITQ